MKILIFFLLSFASLSAQTNPYILGIFQTVGGGCDESDTFTNSDGTDLVAHNADWNYGGGFTTLYVILSNEVESNGSGDDYFASNDGCAFADNQSSELTITALAPQFIGVSVRGALGGAHTFYGFETDDGNSYFFKYVAGSYTQFGNSVSIVSTSELMFISASGTTITATSDGDHKDASPVTDSAITSGFPGLAGNSNGASRGDNWAGKDL